MCSGYALYGSATVVALSTGDGVNLFMLDPVSGRFTYLVLILAMYLVESFIRCIPSNMPPPVVYITDTSHEHSLA